MRDRAEEDQSNHAAAGTTGRGEEAKAVFEAWERLQRNCRVEVPKREMTLGLPREAEKVLIRKPRGLSRGS